MIIPIIAIFAVLVFYFFMFTKADLVRWIFGGISFILLALSVGGLTAHFSHHWGMKTVSKTTTTEIYTAGDTNASFGMMIDVPIGTKSGDYVLVYRDKATDKKPSAHFTPDKKHISESVKKSATYKTAAVKKATLTTTKTTRTWSNDFFKVIFGIGDEDGELVKEKNVVKVPAKTWLVLTQKQAAELQKKAPELQAKMAAEVKADPAKAAQLAQLQKADPEKYTELQVQQIKSLLAIK
ncbi:DUF4811 domain-containing protein [Pseudolactococcus insecticola]|uniref:DUF4811 domain-containing protein n=1 Tax=Pseudolactococcus insecticola TaxID=2709158 RepID=A0A6A0B738_9LACT|nr:DUF4811 domain-containing protein [Lactococcus insecticola]GFH40311.1 DUF4811 domain-containing protein [Lactococcus insecticola]